MRSRRRVLRALVLAPALAVLAACVSIPDSGSVTTRTAEPHATRAPGYIHVFAPPATPGMSQRQIVRGFLLAQVDPELTSARSYLTAEEADRWDPRAQVVVLAGETQPEPQRYSPQELRLTAPQNGVISERGDFTATPGKKALGSFQLTKVNGEWRISSATDGLYLSPNDFSRDYAVYDTYFLDPESRHLVPDPVYLPVGASQATSLVEALLSGPAPWLSPAVRTAFPPGTRLTVASAPVKDNVVQVDLTEQVRQASAEDVELLGAQLAWTLAQLDDVNAVRVTAGGLPVTGLNDSIKTGSFPSVGDPSGADVGPAIAVAGGRLVTLAEPTLPLAGVMGSGTTALVHPAIATGGGDKPSRAAALDPKSTKLYVGEAADNGTLRVRLQGHGLVAPSFDPEGNVWTASVTKSGPAIWVVPPDGAPRQVIAPEVGTRVVRALRIARDGVRAAVVLQSKKGHELYVGHVVRSGDDLRLDGLRRVESVLTDVVDVAWASADNLLVLGEGPGGGLQPYLVEPFGFVLPTGGPLKDIATVTAAPKQRILAGTTKGRIWSTDGTENWTLVRKGSDPSYPG
jgi:hypothetical protein